MNTHDEHFLTEPPFERQRDSDSTSFLMALRASGLNDREAMLHRLWSAPSRRGKSTNSQIGKNWQGRLWRENAQDCVVNQLQSAIVRWFIRFNCVWNATRRICQFRNIRRQPGKTSAEKSLSGFEDLRTEKTVQWIFSYTDAPTQSSAATTR